ncbi:hypothetical protein [Streptomyces sp. F001]|uniref:hypothetical protein n=1 Tax=Streptomyces sp. F001 TaxID=1510026 RepID=UPI001F113CC2|nr:hypothetical protein [Streptomyces sp. F001]
MDGLRRHKSMFLLPGLLTLFLIIIFPLLFTIRVSFSGWNVSNPYLDFIGGPTTPPCCTTAASGRPSPG